MTARDTIVVAAFANTTGNAIFDGALRQALEAELAQSPYLHIVGDQRMLAEENLMGLNPGTPVRGSTALQLCQRTGSVAALEGSIAQAGDQYSLTLQAVQCSSGDTLTRLARAAPDVDHVLGALGQLASGMRTRLGESLSSMSQFNMPVEQVTTPSLAALKAYAQGRRKLLAGENAAARDLFTQALALDPNFAMAYASRGRAKSNLNQDDPQDFTQAYDRRSKVSQRERFYITAHYDDTGRGDLLQAEVDYRAWQAAYPEDDVPRTNLCALELRLGQIPAAVGDCRAARQRDPSSLIATVDLANVELLAGNDAAGRKLLQAALAQHPDEASLHVLLLRFARGAGETGIVAQQTNWLARPAAADTQHNLQWLSELRGGELTAARANLPGSAAGGSDAGDRLLLARQEALLGAHRAARRDAAAALRVAHGDADLANAALVLGICNSATRAEPLDTQVDQHQPQATVMQRIVLPVNRAWVALARHQPKPALKLLAPALPYARGSAAAMLPVYTEGVALLALGRNADAAQAFEKVIAYPFATGLAAASLAQLARAQAALGQISAARANYGKALAAWAHADHNLPLPRAAQREAKRLSTAR